jgi:hypothetical protein
VGGKVSTKNHRGRFGAGAHGRGAEEDVEQHECEKGMCRLRDINRLLILFALLHSCHTCSSMDRQERERPVRETFE